MAHKDNKGIFIMLSEKHQQNILHISNDAGFVKLITIKKKMQYNRNNGYS